MSFPSRDVVVKGIIKLIEDKCKFIEDDGSIEDKRWEVMNYSKEFFTESHSDNYLEFIKFIESKTKRNHGVISETLYADLPDFRILSEYKKNGEEALIHRYNCAQIQGLLIRSKKITFYIASATTVQKRRLVQKLRFLGLIADIHVNDDIMELSVSGPMSIFQGGNAYGMKIANFFPYILLFSKWSLKAEIDINRKKLLLECDSKKKISSHYKDFSGHIPEEYEKICQMIDKAKANEGWSASVCSDFVNLGLESYSFPDLVFKKKDQDGVYMEIFHKWHATELKRRVSSLSSKSSSNLILAVQKSLIKHDGLDKKLDKLVAKGHKVVMFSGFPSTKAVLAQLTN
jgi:predicted nuclease of restriction endonuclease-like RecB superfamily